MNGAPVLEVERGSGLPERDPDEVLLILDGMLLRRVTVRGGHSVELLAEGDVLIPGREDAASFARSEWQAVEPTRLAVLDLSRSSELAQWPSVCAEIATRAVDRSRAFAIQGAIMSIVGVEDRVHALLWALAKRWGRVTSAGVELKLRVDQEALAEMVGARRPTVSTALTNLGRRGLLVAREPGHWLLKGDPPQLEPAEQPLSAI